MYTTLWRTGLVGTSSSQSSEQKIFKMTCFSWRSKVYKKTSKRHAFHEDRRCPFSVEQECYTEETSRLKLTWLTYSSYVKICTSVAFWMILILRQVQEYIHISTSKTPTDFWNPAVVQRHCWGDSIPLLISLFGRPFPSWNPDQQPLLFQDHLV